MNKYSLKLNLSIPQDQVAELIVTTLARLGYRITNANESLHLISATEVKSESSSGVTWRYEYNIVISWTKNSNDVTISINIEERLNKWTHKLCENKCKLLAESLKQDSEFLRNSIDGVDSTLFGSARWADDKDIEKAGYRLFNPDSKRFIFGLDKDNIHLAISQEDTIKHAVICGPTGCGKTTSVFIPNLVERTSACAIVTEATAGTELPDLYAKTAGYRAQNGQVIYYFNPDDLSSNRINPLDSVNTIAKAQLTADLIIKNTSIKMSMSDQIWETSERHLLTSLILHVAFERGHLAMIRRLMVLGPYELGRVLNISGSIQAKSEYAAFIHNSSEGFRNGVLSGLLQRLNLWFNPRIEALTQTTDIDFTSFPDQLFTFYLAVPSHKNILKPLAALVFNYLLDMVLEKNFSNPLFLSLDEFTNYGYIPGIAEKLTIIRHKKIPAMIGAQDWVQVKKIYGDDDATLIFGQPGTKIYFRPRDLMTAKKISDSLGVRTVTDKKVTSTGMVNQKELARPLMHTSEILSLDNDKAIVFTPATSPLLVKKIAWQTYAGIESKFPVPFRQSLDIDEVLSKKDIDIVKDNSSDTDSLADTQAVEDVNIMDIVNNYWCDTDTENISGARDGDLNQDDLSATENLFDETKATEFNSNGENTDDKIDGDNELPAKENLCQEGESLNTDKVDGNKDSGVILDRILRFNDFWNDD